MKRWCASLLCVLALGCDRKDAEPWVDDTPDAGDFAVVSINPPDGTQLPGRVAQVELLFNRSLSILSIRQNENLRLSYPDPAAPAPEADAGMAGDDAGIDDDAGLEADAGAQAPAEIIVPCNFALQKIDDGRGHSVKAIPLPLQELPANTTFTFTVETSVASESGEMLAAPFKSSFTTGSY